MRLVKVLLVLGMVAGVLLTPTTAQAGFGIDPGKVFIDNLFPGAQADVPITVYNQNDYQSTFQVKPRTPDYTEAGYEVLPYLSWVSMTPDRLTIAAGGQSDVLVVVKMPEDADYSGQKCEIWISFMEEETGGFVKIELISRFLISTRTEAKDKNSQPPDKNGKAPRVTGSGSVGITAEAVTPEPAPQPSPSPSPVAIILSVLGVILVGGTVLALVKRRRRA